MPEFYLGFYKMTEMSALSNSKFVYNYPNPSLNFCLFACFFLFFFYCIDTEVMHIKIIA